VRDEDKTQIEPIARGLVAMGFSLIATTGTSRYLQMLGLECERVNKVLEGSPHVVDAMKQGRIAMVINTPDASGTKDSFSIRRTALELRLPYFTTMAGASAGVQGIEALKNHSARSARATGLPSRIASASRRRS